MHCAPHKCTLPLLLQSCSYAGAGRPPCAGRYTAVVPASAHALECAGAHELERRWAHALERMHWSVLGRSHRML